MLASACVAMGRPLTGCFSIKHDLINAGGEWLDQAVFRDGNLITIRYPADLPEFMKALLKALG